MAYFVKRYCPRCGRETSHDATTLACRRCGYVKK